MSDPLETPAEPANLRFLRRLVTVLAGVMIAGLVTLIALFVIRFSSPAPTPLLPGAITLPDGVAALAVTFGDDWYAVVTTDRRILIFDRASAELRQSVNID